MLIIAVSFSSCKDDAEDLIKDLIPDEELLVGKWELVAKVEDGKDVAVTGCEVEDTLVLTSSSITSTEYSGTDCADEDIVLGVYTVEGNKLNFTVQTSEGSETGTNTFEVGLTELRMTGDDDGESYTDVYKKGTQL